MSLDLCISIYDQYQIDKRANSLSKSIYYDLLWDRNRFKNFYSFKVFVFLKIHFFLMRKLNFFFDKFQL